jgi:hypothetical protein
MQADMVSDEVAGSTFLKLAYTAKDSIPPLKRNSLKELSKAMVHVGLPLAKSIGHYRKMTTRWNPVVRELGEEGFRQFLSVLSFFLKAETKERGKMKRFNRVSEERLSRQKLTTEATSLSGKLGDQGDINVNKLKRLGARLSASRDPYEALAHLARFYPLKGVPKEVIDHLVEKLGELDLESFKNLYALGLRFYEARLEGWEG